ncbi:hypothetical protein [Paucisalibacillus globulus]|uniref:hypothetical protein n=1 Tax=Paucisalibacillus globulus TaxID=351095 RepID=UPI000412BC31|nr:hypothetical protein [Paucisalibacillus globulus]
MNIHKVLESQLPKLKETTQMLREGQIIQGRILKLYPNNKATIQLGIHQLIAQLEASLEIGEKYHFQVQRSENITQLKVLGDALTSKSQANLLELLQHLGVKATKENQSFVQLLLENKVPFDKGQLHRAFTLLEGNSSRGQAQTVLWEMIANRTPITDSIFQAKLERVTSGFTERMVALDSALQQNTSISSVLKQGMLEQLQKLSNQGRIVPHIQAIAENQDLFDMLKALKIINPDSQLRNWGDQVKNISSGRPLELNQLFNVEKLQTLSKTIPNLDLIRQNAISLLNQFGEGIQSSVSNGMPLPSSAFTMLSQDVNKKIMQLLQIKKMEFVNTPQQLQYLLQDLETLIKSESHLSLDRFVHQIVKDLFAEQTRNVLENVGLQYEKAILHDDNNPTNTLKGTLLTLIQSSDNILQEQANKLLHFINGMQLQSVHETDKLLQANLLIPAAKMGLNNDIELNFEGKKNEQGEIDPNYCRIIFYLDLETLKKTVVDMHVQKRAISLTILNDNPIENTLKPLKAILKDGLEKINYHLSSVVHKPLTNEETVPSKNPSVYKKTQSCNLGVDFRI